MNSAVAEQNGRLEISTPDNGVGYAGYYARDTFNLTNRRATVELVQAARAHGMDTYFVLHYAQDRGRRLPLHTMQVWLYAGAWGTGNAAPGTAIYDNLRLTPNE